MLVTFLFKHRERITATLIQRIRQAVPAYAQLPQPELHTRVATGVEAFFRALQHDDLAPLHRFITAAVDSRSIEEFPLAMMHTSFAVFGELLMPLLRECYGDDSARILVDLQRLHRFKDAILTHLVATYEPRARVIFQQRQEFLQRYSTQLEQQLIQVGNEFQSLQEFNENIIQSMTSGLLVGDKETHRILKVNRAMERVAGSSAAEMVGKTVEEVFAGYHGLPIGELADEVERQGTISLRKHRLSTDDGREFHQYIKGQVFYDHQGENRGVIVMVDDISQTEWLQETFSRYLSPQVLEQVLNQRRRPALRSTRRDLTVLFVDIRNFSRFAEQHQPEEVVEVLNQYLNIMVEILFAHQGTLDKFLGDGLLAFFGAPLPQADHPQRAVQAALALQDAIAALNTDRRGHGQVTLDVGIGINSGEAIVGNIGSDKRMEYTVIGDMVNIAQRLQARAQGGEICISDTTLSCVASLVTVYDTVEERLKGRQQLVRVHHVGPCLPRLQEG